ncbi:hypothetical protein EVAR_70170_1 [Eumeta japonica]|uniref:Uncharacterized protein n=1 Tax=Eumeta variegata TaxID=151549 RepID=A0A4C1SM98_EUMVA|nr:hypothetical protein EVAR_70170_1 [Eumeta japonica]
MSVDACKMHVLEIPQSMEKDINSSPRSFVTAPPPSVGHFVARRAVHPRHLRLAVRANATTSHANCDKQTDQAIRSLTAIDLQENLTKVRHILICEYGVELEVIYC